MHLLRWTIGSKKLALLFHPIRGKGKPIVIHSHEFPRALRRLHVISSSFDWLILLTSLPLMIGQSGIQLKIAQNIIIKLTKKNSYPCYLTALAIQRGYRDFFLEDPGRQASINVSSANFYKNGLLGDLSIKIYFFS